MLVGTTPSPASRCSLTFQCQMKSGPLEVTAIVQANGKSQMTQGKGYGQTWQEECLFWLLFGFPSLITGLGTNVRWDLWSATIQMIKYLGDGSSDFPFLEGFVQN